MTGDLVTLHCSWWLGQADFWQSLPQYQTEKQPEHFLVPEVLSQTEHLLSLPPACSLNSLLSSLACTLSTFPNMVRILGLSRARSWGQQLSLSLVLGLAPCFNSKEMKSTLWLRVLSSSGVSPPLISWLNQELSIKTINPSWQCYPVLIVLIINSCILFSLGNIFCKFIK